MNTSFVKEGREFTQADPKEVSDFLNARNLQRLEVQPDRLHIAHDGRGLLLHISNGRIHEYAVRKSFLFKLLKWFSFPLNQLHRLNIDTISSILNDFLLDIRSGDVTVTVENGEALTITSRSYSRLCDLDVLDICEPWGVAQVSRNDYFMRLYSRERLKKSIAPGDDFGFGFNVLNSETGFRSLSVHHYLFRYICSNGAIVRIGSHQDERIHYGYRPAELAAWLERQVESGEKSREALVLSLEASKKSVAGKKAADIAGRITAVLGRGDGTTLVDRLREKESAYEMFNFLSREAQKFDIGRRLQLESLAGELLVSTSVSH
ncbi:MAG: hypothetical protein OEM41_04405 [Ignavibacteria bacterium]|nr:hypothetical protein [Ignavibacteria bacterium]